MKKLKFVKYLLIALVVIVLTGCPAMYHLSSEEIEITVSEKDNITSGSGSNMESKFLIYTEAEVFENTDSWTFIKFNSTDLQNEIKEDGTYTVKVAGWRIPFFSSYRNIIEIK